MDDLIYNRQQNIAISVPEIVSIVGCGGVGVWVAIFLALVGVPHLKLFDGDIIETHNLNRVPFTLDDISQPKVSVLKKYVESTRRECFVETYGHVDELSQYMLSGVVVDCTDAPIIQQKISQYCENNKIRYYRVGCDANHITILTSLKELWGEDEEPGYEVVPNYVVPPVLVAILTVHAIVKEFNDVSILADIDSYIETFGGRVNE